MGMAGTAGTVLAAGGFATFGTSHLVMLAIFVAGIWPMVRIGKALRGTDNAVRFSRGFALAIPAFTLPLLAIDLTPSQFDFASTLPIQLCDLAWLASTWALWTQRPYAVALTYYWGLVLTTQAIITPWLVVDFPEPKFIGFWGMHLLIVWAAVFLTWGLGIRPTWRLFRSTVLTTVVWAVSVFTFNVIAETNYGFLNEKPNTPSILDYLGPWPLYVVLEVAILLAVWALITWPWVAAEKRRAGEVAAASSSPSNDRQG